MIPAFPAHLRHLRARARLGERDGHNPKTEQWVKRDTDSGRFLDVKQDGDKFKGVRREK